MKHQVLKSVFFAAVIPFGFILQSCSSSDVGGKGDATKPVVTLSGIVDANSTDDEIIGEATIQWVTDDPNRSTVDIYLSIDSGVTYPTQPLANDEPDTGEYVFDTNDIEDCRYCRLRIVAKDVVGNVSDAVDSTEDFVINNVPQVLGVALFVDPGSDGATDGDSIIVPFDKDVEVRKGLASDIFFLPVLGDNIGAFASLGKGARANELVITLTDMSGQAPFTGHLHISKEFNSTRVGRTAPSGLNVYDKLPEGVLYARDTGRTAAFVEGGIDIVAGFADPGITIGADGAPIVTGDVDNDGDLDMIQGSYGGVAADANTGFRVLLRNSNVQLTAVAPQGGYSNIAYEFCESYYDPYYSYDYINYVYIGATVCRNVNTLALAKLNAGNYPDLIQGSNGSNLANAGGARVWLKIDANNGDFMPTPAVLCSQDSYGYCQYTQAFAFADVNDAGGLDVIEASSSGVRIWLNNGSGTDFAEDVTQRLSSCSYDDPNVPGCEYYYYAYSVVAGDIDSDGYQDVIVSSSEKANQVWLNNGSGTFTDTGQSLSFCDNANPLLQPCNYYAYTSSMVLVDVDGDTDLDLATAGANSGAGHGYANRIWLNNGAGIFTDSGRSLGNFQVNAITAADTDDDGKTDLVQATDYGSRVWRNIGQGRFSDSGQVLGGSANRVAVGDVDGDTDRDVIAVGYGAKLFLNSLQNTSSQYFVDSGQLGVDTNAVVLGDLDGDGDLDKIEGSTGKGSRVLLNNISGVSINRGVYTDSGQLLCSTNQYANCSNAERNTLTLADVDGDSDLDLLEANYGYGNRLWLNDGNGVFTDSGQRLSNCDTNSDDPGTPYCDSYYGSLSIAVADLDGDGDRDLAVGEHYQGVQIWLNNGQGSFSKPVSGGLLATTNYIYSVVLGNVDGVAGVDLVVNSYGAQLQVWHNDGQGNFTTLGSAFGGAYVSSIILGDVDGDTYPDLILGNYYDYNLSSWTGNQIWKNNGSGGFTLFGAAPSSSPANRETNALALGDVDDDGDLDMVAGNYYLANELWLNNGSGTFTSGQSLCKTPDLITPANCNSTTYSLVLGDVDDDDDLDVIQVGNQANAVWLNDF